ncbi:MULTISPECIES: hypothetical protein [unclassified Lentimicrobium]|uniref:hypothetical protein n=1 Tax=unclassified Lentimicrobium TaxID=2677434 RepID=UPI001554474C|nr:MULTISPECIES: hypothetical protein [unclassified Lentimicrobium]NPD45285.1 hypothetical protein [Lentimicrobium sp. S6]NPD84415.1 hypothetical protein [Lentimicrobium sp. L6]
MHIVWALGLLLLISCQPSVLKKLDKQSESTKLKIEGLASFQSSNEIHYRSKVDAFGQKLSGQLILKNQDTNFRAVMITDFGLKVMDLTISKNGDYQMNHIMKHMDYKFVKHSMALNILMLLPQDFNIEVQTYSSDQELLVYAPQIHSIYFLEQDDLKKVERFRGKNKLWATAEKVGEDMISIIQKNPDIAISLKKIE